MCIFWGIWPSASKYQCMDKKNLLLATQGQTLLQQEQYIRWVYHSVGFWLSATQWLTLEKDIITYKWERGVSA